MMRQYIVESVKYWVKEYHIDGFRFDLMGIHDIATMNLLRQELDAIDPQILVYGEGWLAGGSPLADELRAVKANVPSMPRIAVFSDELRDGVKGPWNDHKGTAFASGKTGLEESVKFGIVGAINHPGIDYTKVNYSQQPWATEPLQCINYVSCHDNHTLWDKFHFTCPGASFSNLVRMNKLSNAIVLTSQGIPFLHSGVEMLRTKLGVENSYESPDSINQIDWDWKTTHADVVDFHTKLIQLRKAHPVFRLGSAALVAEKLRFLPGSSNVISYLIDGTDTGDTWKEVFVTFNGNPQAVEVDLPHGEWKIIVDGNSVNMEGKPLHQRTKLEIPPISAVVLAR